MQQYTYISTYPYTCCTVCACKPVVHACHCMKKIKWPCLISCTRRSAVERISIGFGAVDIEALGHYGSWGGEFYYCFYSGEQAQNRALALTKSFSVGCCCCWGLQRGCITKGSQKPFYILVVFASSVFFFSLSLMKKKTSTWAGVNPERTEM